MKISDVYVYVKYAPTSFLWEVNGTIAYTVLIPPKIKHNILLNTALCAAALIGLLIA